MTAGSALIDLLTMLVATAALVYGALVTSRRLRGPGDTAVEHVLTVALLVGVGILAVSLLVGRRGSTGRRRLCSRPSRSRSRFGSRSAASEEAATALSEPGSRRSSGWRPRSCWARSPAPGTHSVGYQVLAGLEESLEKLGVGTVAAALLDHVRRHVAPVAVVLER